MKGIIFLSIIALASASLPFHPKGFNSREPICPPDVEEQYIPHETDCTKYYVCSFGTPQLMTCAEGTEFNPTTNQCDWIGEGGCFSLTTTERSSTAEETTVTETTTTPEETTVTDTTSTTVSPQPNTTVDVTTLRPPCAGVSGAFEPHETDCDKYYFCLNGVPQLLNCPDGQEFNPDTERCQPISNDGCTAKLTSDSPETTTAAVTTPEPTSTSRPICQGVSGGFEPHETDCDKYYFCLNGIPQLLSCPDGQEYNPAIERCEVISDDGCSSKLTSDKPQTTPEPTTKSPPCTGINTGFEPHETDCDRYYFCINGIPQLQRCPDGQEFNPTSERCEPISDDGCSSKTSKAPEKTTSAPKTPCTDILTGFEPHESDCTKYYFCIDGISQEFQCPKGHEYNPVIEDCEVITDSGCSALQAKGNIFSKIFMLKKLFM